ncbi:peptidylprolyl isomerase [Anaeromyxobacter oryzisoli]|uniref:peptidylprolyl isomerase n=1 Tax=Anaeromyxobacter oryzisoli TaxID=2925408 RepID=UPI001F595BB2|nr:peptidyl-prolyl cis-trans isomerase [Anaeromyxobacter sp. SG63]
MKKAFLALVIVLAAGGGYWAGRGSRAPSVLDGSGEGAIVVSFGGEALRTSEVEARVRAMPEMARARLATPEARKRFVEDLARERILARRAEEKGYQRDPEFARRYAQELGSFYLEKELDEPERRKAPEDGELRKYFEEHQAELSRPERIRIALVEFKVPDPAARQKKLALARQTLSEARAGSKDYYAFGRLARARSEDERTRASSGEVGYASREDLEGGYGPELAKAAFDLKIPGELGGAVVESASALYLVKLVGREAAYEPRFEIVRDALAARLANERREADRKRFLDDLWKQANVRIDEDPLGKLELASKR